MGMLVARMLLASLHVVTWPSGSPIARMTYDNGNPQYAADGATAER